MKRFAIELLATLFAFIAVPLHAQQAPLGPYGNIPWNVSGNTAIDTATLVVGQMTGLLTGTPTGAANYTTPSATAICALFPFVASQSAQNWQYDWYVKNTSLGANTITVVAGSGVTVVGTGTATQNNLRHFKIVLNTCNGTPAVQVVSLELAPF